MSSDPIVTSGISVGDADGPVPLRQEIRSLEKNFPDLWNLYVLGLKEFQDADETDLLSYYQISGIHGRPFTPYNGVEGNQETGYCTHSSILFPTWHRPYLALFEEVLYSIVQKKATEFSQQEGRSRYVAAAKDFRIPYWDWVAVLPTGTSPFPASLATAKINVVSPGSNGVARPIDNPLYSFKFHPLNPNPGDFDDNSAVGSFKETVRHPRIVKGVPVSQNDAILNGGQTRNLRERLFGLITSVQDYQPFSNNEFGGTGPGEYSSLESIHDNIHVAVGGSGNPVGHMTRIEYSAFDPVFWLHHTNVDRCFAIWQALYPDSYVVPQTASNDTLTTQAGTEENETSSLTPFWADSQDFWTSDAVRKTGTFGYAYPETQAWKFNTPEQYKSNVSTVFRRLYGGSNLGSILAESTPGNLSSRARLNLPVSASVKSAPKAPAKPTASAPAEASSKATSSQSFNQSTIAAFSVEQVKAGDQKPLAEAKPKLAESKAEATHGNPKAEPAHENPKAERKQDTSKHRDITDLAINGKYLEWITNFKVEKHGLGGTFTVHVFLGDFDRDDPTSWRTTENKVGSFNVLGDSADSGCGKCKNDQSRQLQVTGQVPLTLALAERYLTGQLANLKPESVIPYLQTHLHWRVTLADGTEKARGEVPALTVSVYSHEVKIPTAADQLPQFSDQTTIHPAVTTARNGDGRGEGTGLTDVSQA